MPSSGFPLPRVARPRCEGGLMLPRMPPKRIRETSAPGPASRTPGLSFCPRPLAQRLCPRPRTKALHKAFGQGSILGTGSLSCKSGQETWPDLQVQVCPNVCKRVRLYKSLPNLYKRTSSLSNLYTCCMWACTNVQVRCPTCQGLCARP